MYVLNIAAEKAALRTQISQRRDALLPEVAAKKSEEIGKLLWQIACEKQARNVHTYLSIGSELSTDWFVRKLLTEGRRVIVPKTLAKPKLEHLLLTSLDDLGQGKFGTRIPKKETVFEGELDLIVVPGLAFDKQNYRLGYGGGYYDNFLTKQTHALKIGVGFRFQWLEKIPHEAHDVPLNQILLV